MNNKERQHMCAVVNCIVRIWNQYPQEVKHKINIHQFIKDQLALFDCNNYDKFDLDFLTEQLVSLTNAPVKLQVAYCGEVAFIYKEYDTTPGLEPRRIMLDHLEYIPDEDLNDNIEEFVQTMLPLIDLD